MVSQWFLQCATCLCACAWIICVFAYIIQFVLLLRADDVGKSQSHHFFFQKILFDKFNIYILVLILQQLLKLATFPYRQCIFCSAEMGENPHTHTYLYTHTFYFTTHAHQMRKRADHLSSIRLSQDANAHGKQLYVIIPPSFNSLAPRLLPVTMTSQGRRTIV